MKSEISVIIVNWNTRDLLRACLNSLQAESKLVPLEIIVVDNASTDQSVETLSPEFPQVHWFKNPVNAGFAAASNQGLRQAGGDYWGLLNPDTEVLPGALQQLRQELAAGPELMVVGPQLLNTDDSLQPSGRRFPGWGRMAGEMFFPAGWKKSRRYQQAVFGRTDFSQPAWVDEVSGACFFARRETFARVGLLDEAYFLYFEEVDWFRRLARLGGRVRYLPGARVVHHGGGASAQAAAASVLANARSAFYYWRKFHGGWSLLALRGLFIFRALLGLAGQAVSAFLGGSRGRAFPAKLRLYGNLLLAALGISK